MELRCAIPTTAAIAAEGAGLVEDRRAADAHMPGLVTGSDALEAIIPERPARREICLMRGPSLIRGADLDDIPSLLGGGHVMRAVSIRDEGVLEVLVLLPEPVGRGRREIAKPCLVLAQRRRGSGELGGLALEPYPAVLERDIARCEGGFGL